MHLFHKEWDGWRRDRWDGWRLDMIVRRKDGWMDGEHDRRVKIPWDGIHYVPENDDT